MGTSSSTGIKTEEKEDNSKKESEEEEEEEEEEEDDDKYYGKKEENINELLNQLENELIKINEKIKNLTKEKDILELKIKRIKDKKNKVPKQMHNDIYDKQKNKQKRAKKVHQIKKYIKTSKALKMESKDPDLFILGLISKNLNDIGIGSAIEKKNNFEEQINDFSWFNFLINNNKKKYVLDFEFGEKKNKELLNNKGEYKKFEKKLRSKLSKDFNISEKKIILDATISEDGAFRVQIIFESEEFNTLDKNQFINKFKNDPDFEELKNLKGIFEDVVMGVIKLSKNQLDPEGNRKYGWAIGEKRGGFDYDPPNGWTGIGLRVKGRYDNGDDTWIGMSNVKGEWCVAYHGVGRGQSSDNVKKVTGKIIKGKEFKPGFGQVHKNCLDIFHLGTGQKVGEGVYCTPHIKTAENYAGISDINGEPYKTVLMVRVKPDAIRHCSDSGDYWVVNGNDDEIRPYRILYKNVNNN